MTYHIRLELPGVPKGPNRLGGRHWSVRKKHHDQWYQAVAYASAGKRPKEPLTSPRIKITRVANRKLDFDNAVASMKPVIDGLRYAGIIADDRASVVTKWDVDQEFCAKGREKTVVEVWALPQDDE